MVSSEGEHRYQVDADGVDLACRSTGAGPALVWAHALLSSMAHEDRAPIFDWSGTTRWGRRWLRYDARGHGRSGGDERVDHLAWPQLASDMLVVADGSDLATFAGGGASMGCATSLWCAHLAPDRVEKLVLALPPTAWNSRRRQAGIYRVGAVSERLRLTLPLRLGSRLVPDPGRSPTRTGYLRSSLTSMAAMSPEQVAVALRGAAGSDLPGEDQLAKIDAPALILAWPGDRSHPLKVAKTLQRQLPDATLDIADDDQALQRWPDVVSDFLA